MVAGDRHDDGGGRLQKDEEDDTNDVGGLILEFGPKLIYVLVGLIQVYKIFGEIKLNSCLLLWPNNFIVYFIY